MSGKHLVNTTISVGYEECATFRSDVAHSARGTIGAGLRRFAKQQTGRQLQLRVPAVGDPSCGTTLRTVWHDSGREQGTPRRCRGRRDLFDHSLIRITDFAGRILSINAWASWCAPCRTETPRIADSGNRTP